MSSELHTSCSSVQQAWGARLDVEDGAPLRTTRLLHAPLEDIFPCVDLQTLDTCVTISAIEQGAFF